jgi:transposase InsO family protein
LYPDKPEVRKLFIEKNGKFYRDFPGFILPGNPMYSWSPEEMVYSDEYSDSEDEDFMNEDKEVEFYSAYTLSEQEKLLSKYFKETDRPPKPRPFCTQDRLSCDLHPDVKHMDEKALDDYFEELDMKYKMSFVFGKTAGWELLMKHELCRGTGIDPNVLPPMRKPEPEIPRQKTLWKQYPAVRGRMYNLLRKVPETECEIPDKPEFTISNPEEQFFALEGAEETKFDFKNDEVIKKECEQVMVAETTPSANVIINPGKFCGKILSRKDMPPDSENDDSTKVSEESWRLSDDYSTTSEEGSKTSSDEESDDADDEIEGTRKEEREKWNEDHLKFYDMLEKTRYDVASLEAHLDARINKKRDYDDSDESRMSKKSRSEEEDEEDAKGEIYFGLESDGRVDWDMSHEKVAEFVEEGIFDMEEGVLYGPTENPEAVTLVSVTEEEEIKAIEDDLASRPNRVRWADQVAKDTVAEEFVLYAMTDVDRPRNSALESWLIDSGATVHVTTNNKDMVEVRETSATVIVGDGEEVPATSRGTLLLATEDNQVIKLKDVLVVPNFTKHIISLPRLMQGNVNVTEWTGARVKLACPSGKTITINKENDGPMYYVHARRIKPLNDEVHAIQRAQQIMDINEAHEKFAHLSEGLLRKTALHYGYKLTGTLMPCDGCMKAKAKAKAVKKFTETKATKPGERLFMDTTGPFEPTCGGTRYDVKIVDQYSRKTWGARIKNRSKIPRLMDIHFHVMKGKRKPVKYLRCDNTGEHGAALKTICAQHGVTLEMTAPNTPQQNGVVERKIVTDRTRAHAMLEAARLNDKAKALLRAEAEATAEKISNICCNNHCGTMFPNDMFGEASRLRPRNLVQFGRIGYVTNRVKLQKK